MYHPNITEDIKPPIKAFFLSVLLKNTYRGDKNENSKNETKGTVPTMPVSDKDSPQIVCAGTLPLNAAVSLVKNLGAIFVLLKCSKKEP